MIYYLYLLWVSCLIWILMSYWLLVWYEMIWFDLIWFSWFWIYLRLSSSTDSASHCTSHVTCHHKPRHCQRNYDLRTIHTFIHSFNHSIIHSFIQSLIHWFIDSLIHWLIDSFIHSFVHSSFIRSLISFTYFIHSLLITHSFIHSLHYISCSFHSISFFISFHFIPFQFIPFHVIWFIHSINHFVPICSVCLYIIKSSIETKTEQTQTVLALIARTVADEYVENHAVRKSQVAWALGSQSVRSGHKVLKRSKTNVSGKGQYRVWTAQAMLRVTLLD